MFFKSIMPMPPKKDSGPGLFEMIDMIFTDTEIEGKKQGYEKASKEYSNAYQAILKEYEYVKKTTEREKEINDLSFDVHIKMLEELEEKQKILEKKLSDSTKKVSSRYNISVSEVSRLSSQGILGTTTNSTPLLLDVIYNYKKSKLLKAKEEGYKEAKDIFEKKIAAVKSDISSLKRKAKKELKEYFELIENIMLSIIKKSTEIAELEILLSSKD